jgi:linearmycin/streptolysin S transport system permease protein
MRAALVITVRILRQRIRDRSAIIFAVITPLGLALAFTALIPNEFSTYHTRIAVVDQDGGPMATTLVDQVFGHLEEADVATIVPTATASQAEQAVRDGDVGAAVVIPAGFSDAIMQGDLTQLRIITGEFTVAGEVARATAARFASDVGAVQLMLATESAATGQAPDPTAIGAAQAAVQEASPIAVTDDSTERLQANLATFYGAAMAIMFVFFATQYGALAILAERQTGTLSRLLAAPISQGTILFGSALAGLVLGYVAMSVLLVATTLLVGANWGPPGLVLLLIGAAVIAAMGISMVVATLAKTVSQAGSLNAIVALSMAAVGGVFIPLSQAPEVLVNVSLITPHAWFLRAIDTLSGPDPTLSAITPSLLVLVGMGVVLGGIGLIRARGALVPQ